MAQESLRTPWSFRVNPSAYIPGIDGTNINDDVHRTESANHFEDAHVEIAGHDSHIVLFYVTTEYRKPVVIAPKAFF